MPELPEVETTCRGIAPHIVGKRIVAVTIRQPQLRWPIPMRLPELLEGMNFNTITRRAKYLLLQTGTGTLIIHLGMSGSLRIVNREQQTSKHDHLDIVFNDGRALRFNDPRRFGAVLWTSSPVNEHFLLHRLGPEPLTEDFNGDYLYAAARGRKTTVKALIMDSHIVVGVGNIYASESLFMAGILPSRQAGRISLRRYQSLVGSIKNVLQRSIDQGGTTLRDFVNEQGKPGYFQQSLSVYGRAGEPCRHCLSPIKQIKIAQRATYFCRNCQS